MLTPIDIQNKTFKGGIGFDKKEVEIFMSVLSNDYAALYSSNVELKDKVATLNESLQNYRTKEDTVQKALTLSEITAEEIINAAKDKAKQIENEAEKKAEAILEGTKQELLETKNEIDRLQKLYVRFKEQYLNSLEQQIKLVNHEIEEIDLGDDFESSYKNKNSSEFGFGEGSSLNGLNGGLSGGYVGSGSMDDRFEHTNQASTSNQTSLNMDPFASAANGGRFSSQTGKGFTSNRSDSVKKTTNQKSGFNVKSTTSQPKPVPQSKPVSEPQPIPQSKPVPEPQPVPQSQPTP
ncbi:MAG: DivIVA domain-containing protein [Lachnospiraceae bacterium]|nr:DivIVA domain-containing protein [Lachnospiraceae bacterium]